MGTPPIHYSYTHTPPNDARWAWSAMCEKWKRSKTEEKIGIEREEKRTVAHQASDQSPFPYQRSPEMSIKFVESGSIIVCGSSATGTIFLSL